jgi:cellulose synthase/poly-beta-1,6-N-acetylglucosamine synthase-like glycosyltransferase
MPYDKFWVFGVFLVIAMWALVLVSTSGYIVTRENVLVNTDIDLFIPTFAAMLLILVYIFLGAFILITYIFRIKELGQNHLMIKEKQYQRSAIKKGSINELCSIVVPARDEEAVIRNAVLMCLRQTYQNIEVLVIAHNSIDRTYNEAKVDDKRVRSFNLKTKASGKAIALNYGVEQSRGKYILIIDADTVLKDDFVENAMLALDDGRYAAIQGRVFPINRGYNFVTKMMAMEDDLWQEPIMTTRTIFGERCPLLGTGFIIRKDILVQEGMFGNALVDDYELTCRLIRKKHRIIYLPSCKAFAEEPPSLEGLLRQRARWGKGFINCLNRKMADLSDVIGNLLWLMPLGSFANSVMFFVTVYATIHYLIFEYIPYSFAYLPLQMWFLLAGVVIGLDFIVLLKVRGLKDGLRQAVYLLPFLAFSQYGLVVCYKALFVRSWGTTKTVHGFTTKVETNLTK